MRGALWTPDRGFVPDPGSWSWWRIDRPLTGLQGPQEARRGQDPAGGVVLRGGPGGPRRGPHHKGIDRGGASVAREDRRDNRACRGVVVGGQRDVVKVVHRCLQVFVVGEGHPGGCPGARAGQSSPAARISSRTAR